MTAASGSDEAPAVPPFEERLWDRINPIVAREVHQTLASKGFLVVMGLAMAAIMALGLMVALRPRDFVNHGREMLLAVWVVMAPGLFLILPMQMYNSMQHELRQGAADQLLMSDLTPRRIVRGKMITALLLVCLVMSCFAPLLALTFVLRGVDALTIGICLGFAMLFALGAAMVGIAAGALSSWKPLQAIARLGVSVGLASMTVGFMAGGWEMLRDLGWAIRGGYYGELASIGVAVLAGVVLLGMVAATVLTHPYENRSTPFRLFLPAAVSVAYAIAWWTASPRDMQEFAPGFGAIASAWAGVFGLGAVTEPVMLSPRVRTLVPRRLPFAWLAAPFLPGSDRGYLWVLATLAALLGLTWLVPRLHGGLPPRTSIFVVQIAAAAYTVIFVTLARIFRGSSRQLAARRRALVGVLAMFLAGCLVPAIGDVLVGDGIGDWHWGHLFNPFFTGERLERGTFGATGADRWTVVGVVVAIATIGVLSRIPAIWRGQAEALEAARARRG